MSRDSFMQKLAGGIRWKCGEAQAADILKDYGSSFDEGLAKGENEETLCAKFGDPRAAARVLLREEGTSFWAMPWVRLLLMAGAVLGVAGFRFGWYTCGGDGIYWLLMLLPAALFLSVYDAPRRKSRASAKVLCTGLYMLASACFLLGCAAACHLEFLYGLHLKAAGAVSDGAVWQGYVNGAVSFVWNAAAVSAAGAWLASLRTSGKGVFPAFLSVSIIMAGSEWNYTILHFDAWIGGPVSVLLLGLVTAVLFSFLLRLVPRRVYTARSGRAERIGALLNDPVRSLFLDSLSRQLKFRFAGWERREILEDYAECFEVGMQEGRSAAELCRSFGSPEAIAALLFRERRGRLLKVPAAKAGAAALVCAMLRVMYGGAFWWQVPQSVQNIFTAAALPALPVLLLLAAGKSPAAGCQAAGNKLAPLYISAALLIVLPPLAVLASAKGGLEVPVMAGPVCMALLFAGLAAAGSAALLELRLFPGVVYFPPLFVIAGYIVSNARLGALLHTMLDSDGLVSGLRSSFAPLFLGLLLALLCAWALNRPGSRRRFAGFSCAGQKPRDRAGRVQRVSRALALT